MNPINSQSRQPATRHDLPVHAVPLAATAALLALPVSVEASIVYSGPQNIQASWGYDGFSTKNLDLDGDAVNDFDIRGFSSGSWYVGAAIFRGLGANQAARNGSNQLKRLASGAQIPGTLGFAGGFLDLARDNAPATTGGSLFSQIQGSWPEGSTGFAALSFDISGQKHFGWIRLRWNTDTGTTFPRSITAIDWAYEDIAGSKLVAGQTSAVPEASTGLAVLALGGASLAAWRRGRKSAPASGAAVPAQA